MADQTRLDGYLDSASREFSAVGEERRADLAEVAEYIRGRGEKSADLIFICTHNSRRSQLAQVWAEQAARYYQVSGVRMWSGGTEVTACNPRTVAALRRAGVPIEQESSDENPRYVVGPVGAQSALATKLFSKKYDEDPNPKSDFCAVMTCGSADEACPIVRGCAKRVRCCYDDPKAADDTPEEAATYDERCRQICIEMLYLMSVVEPR